MMTDINIKGISRCADCLAIKLFVDKIKEKNELEVIVSQFFNRFLIKQNMITYCVKCKNSRKI